MDQNDPKIVALLSIIADKENALATSKKPLLAPISPDNWTF